MRPTMPSRCRITAWSPPLDPRRKSRPTSGRSRSAIRLGTRPSPRPMIAKGYIDPKKLCVTGGSGGGLLTAWIIGHTDRFAAAVSQYPVTNWITQAGTADGGYTHAALWMKSMPWDNPQQFMDHSPIFFAKNFKTPTMVLTGESHL